MIFLKLQQIYTPYLAEKPYTKGKEHFVPCGVVDEETYLSSKPKLVVVLREVNDPDHTLESVADFLRWQVSRGLEGEKIYHMWKRVGIWSYAIHNGFARYRDLDSYIIAAKGLRLIGMTNLNKQSGGDGMSEDETIRKWAKETLDLWKRELEIMDPDLVLCCGTYWIVSELLKLNRQQTLSGPWYSVWERNDRGTLVASFYHPSYRGRSAMLYAFLKEALLELREKGLW